MTRPEGELVTAGNKTMRRMPKGWLPPGYKKTYPKKQTKRGLGTWISKLLSRCGLSKRRFKRLKYYLGLAPSCGCGVREEQLNRFGVWVRKALVARRKARVRDQQS